MFGHIKIKPIANKSMNKRKPMDMEKAPENSGKKPESHDMTVFKTPNSTYRFTPSWVEHEGLKDILVGLISDDLGGKQ